MDKTILTTPLTLIAKCVIPRTDQIALLQALDEAIQRRVLGGRWDVEGEAEEATK